MLATAAVEHPSVASKPRPPDGSATKPEPDRAPQPGPWFDPHQHRQGPPGRPSQV